MADYGYEAGAGVTRLNKANPVGSQEPATISDDAIRQVKAYLRDPVEGPDAKLSALLAQITAFVVPTNNIPPGTVVYWTDTVIPSGFLWCNGATFSAATYPNLNTAIGTTWGAGPKLPDLRGYTIIGVGSGFVLGTAYGEVTHKLTLAEYPAHVHSGQGGGLMTAEADPVTAAYREAPALALGVRRLARTLTEPIGGGDLPHNNVQPSVALNFIIKT